MDCNGAFTRSSSGLVPAPVWTEQKLEPQIRGALNVRTPSETPTGERGHLEVRNRTSLHGAPDPPGRRGEGGGCERQQSRGLQRLCRAGGAELWAKVADYVLRAWLRLCG